MNPFLRLIVCTGLAFQVPLSIAEPPKTINYQGYLTSNSGSAPVNGAVVMTFKLHNSLSGVAPPLWTEIHPSVSVTNGAFSVALGTFTPLTLPFDVPYWLTVTINADGEMSPRQPLASSAYAFRAMQADASTTAVTAATASTASTLSGTISGTQITGPITTATIAGSQVIGAVAGTLTAVTATAPLMSSGGITPNVFLGGIVPVVNGGTGSSTQNFLDLTSIQTVAGVKQFSATVTAPGFTVGGVGGFTYFPAQTRVLSVPPSAFQPESPIQNLIDKNTGNSSQWIAIWGGYGIRFVAQPDPAVWKPVTGTLLAPVHFPDGVNLTDLTCRLTDNSPTVETTIYLGTMNRPGISSVAGSTATTTGTSGDQLLSANLNNHTVNNGFFSYEIVYQPGNRGSQGSPAAWCGGNDCFIQACWITYSQASIR